MKLATELRVFVSGDGVKAELFNQGKLLESYLVAAPWPMTNPIPPPIPPKTMPTLADLVLVIKAAQFEFPSLKAYCLAQWMVESGRGTSKLFQEHNNAGGMKWRKEMEGYATPVEYVAHDGKDVYCSFDSLEAWIRGYWRFIERAPYAGWREAAKKSGEEYIKFLKVSDYAEDPNYVTKVLALVPEAKKFLGIIDEKPSDWSVGLLDPGHSERQPGARSLKGAQEEDLNLLQSQIILDYLEDKAGIKSEIYNPNVDNLKEIGLKAKGKKFFVSNHHNSYEGKEDPGTETFVSIKRRSQDIRLAEKIQEKICKALGTKNRGVKFVDYTVLKTSSDVCDGPCVLTESYFLQPYTPEEAVKRSSDAAKAIAEAIIEYFSEIK